MVGTATTPVGALPEPVVAGVPAVEGVAAVAEAGANPLKLVRETPEVSARPLN